MTTFPLQSPPPSAHNSASFHGPAQNPRPELSNMTTRANQILTREQYLNGGVTPAKPRAPWGSVKRAKSTQSRIEQQFLARWSGPAYATEYRFHPTRQWRLDYAWPAAKVAVEVEGAIFSRGKSGHNSGMGIARDADKANAAQMLGWIYLRITDKTNLDDFIHGLTALLEARTPKESDR